MPLPPRPARPPLPLRKKLLFAALLALGFPLLAEGAARLIHGPGRHWLDCHRPDPDLGWTLREGWAGKWSWTGGASRINAEGLRRDDDLGPKPAGQLRVLCVGDSVTFGAKVTTAEAFPAQVEQRLKPTHPRVLLLNGGVSSYDPSQEADWLEKYGWRHQPDLILLEFCRNDLGCSPRQQHALAQAGAAGTWLTEHSLLAFKLRGSLAKLAAPPATKPPAAKGQGGWSALEAAYRRVAASAQGRSVPVALLIFPHLDALEGKEDDGLSPKLRRLADELGWRTLDLDAAFRVPTPATLYLPDDPIHPTAAGYARAAEAIASELRTLSALAGTK